MLVLTRRSGERILLPGIEASLEVLDIKGDRVRLGIEAPAHVKILREELAGKNPGSNAAPAALSAPAAPNAASELLSKQRHALRNQLNMASIGVALAARQIKAGMNDSALGTLEQVGGSFRGLTSEVESMLVAISNSSPAEAKPAVVKRGLTALLVEDDHNECELLAGFFRLAGYTVATAEDGCIALDYLQNHETPDVMLLDMMLPRLDGPSTIRRVRQIPALEKLRIFAMSGYTPDQVGLDCQSARVDRWFQKPLNPEHLLKELTDFSGAHTSA